VEGGTEEAPTLGVGAGKKKRDSKDWGRRRRGTVGPQQVRRGTLERGRKLGKCRRGAVRGVKRIRAKVV